MNLSFLCSIITVFFFSCGLRHSPPDASVLNNDEVEMKQISAAKLRWPQSTGSELKAGALMYRTKCIRCHGNYQLAGFSEDRWKYELHRMATMAKLTELEEQQVTQYVISLRDVEMANLSKR